MEIYDAAVAVQGRNLRARGRDPVAEGKSWVVWRWLCFVSAGMRMGISCALILQFTRQAVYGDIVNGCFPPFSQRTALIPVSLTLPRLQEEGLRSGSCRSERSCPGSWSGQVRVCLCAVRRTTRATTSVLIHNNEEMDGCGSEVWPRVSTEIMKFQSCDIWRSQLMTELVKRNCVVWPC